MFVRLNYLITILMAFGVTLSLGSHACQAQSSVAEFHNILREKLALDENDLAALQRGHTVVKSLPVKDKREVAVSGLVGLQVPTQVFLDSFRESMAKKSNAAILEIGQFSSEPTLDDLKGLTFESRDIEDLKTCVVGNCQVKLSAGMIERLQKEVNWNASDYGTQASQLLKLMLLDYVREYSKRGDNALIEYADKETTVRLADEQRALTATSTYINDVLTSSQDLGRSTLTNIENAIVWSKIKFGLKPVIAINHISIYKNQNEIGPQILIASKQIYANHYFNSSLRLTAFVKVPGANPGTFLISENRSRSDSLGGPFGKIKREIVEDKAVSGLTAILDKSKLTLSGNQESATAMHESRSRRRWKIAGLFLLLVPITAFAAFIVLKITTGKLKSPEKRPA